MIRRLHYTVMFVFISLGLISQEDKTHSLQFKGYLDDLQMVQFSKVSDPWILNNEINNRLDLTWKPGSVFSLGAGMRNRFIFGQYFIENPDFKSSLFTDNGLINMTWDVTSGQSYAMVTQFDRAWTSVTAGKFAFTAGRQRINWGQATVWNPNDIFNTYSWFDVDYPERPGSDAVRFQLYPSATSTVELVSGWNSDGHTTAAALGRFNAGGYDIQFLGGLVAGQDWVAGAGWSGNLAGAAFRGEVCYYQPKKKFSDTTGVLLATVGADYTFPFSLSLTFQALYNQLPDNYLPSSLISVYQPPASPKTLSFAEWNLLLMGSYPVTPLLNASLAGIWYPDLDGFYLGPTLAYNVKENVDLTLFIQYFNGKFDMPEPVEDMAFRSFLGMFRVKWCF